MRVSVRKSEGRLEKRRELEGGSLGDEPARSLWLEVHAGLDSGHSEGIQSALQLSTTPPVEVRHVRHFDAFGATRGSTFPCCRASLFQGDRAPSKPRLHFLSDSHHPRVEPMARSKAAKNRSAGDSTPPRPAPPSPAAAADDSASSTQGDDDDYEDTFEDALPSTAQPSTPASVHTQEAGDLEPGAVNGEPPQDTSHTDHSGSSEGGPELFEPGDSVSAQASSDDDDASSPPAADDPERAQTPTLSNPADTTPPRTPTSAAARTVSRPSSIASTGSSSAGLTRESNRLSLSAPSSADNETGPSSPTDQHHHEGDDSLSELPSSSSFSPGGAGSGGPAPKRPFSLSSEPETPTAPGASSTTSPPASPARPKTERRRSSLLASPFGAAPTDPTNVGREGSASLTQAVWRQSLGLNSSPAARTLVDVQLHDEDEEEGRGSAEEEGEDGDEAREGRNGGTPRARREGSKRRSVLAATGAVHPASASSASASDADDPAAAGSYAGLSHGAPRDNTRGRQASVAEPHAADGFLSNRYSVNLSSLSTPSGTSTSDPHPPAHSNGAAQGAEPETASNGIQRLQAEFLKVRERQELEGDEAMAIDWDFWGRVMNDYEEVARTQRAFSCPFFGCAAVPLFVRLGEHGRRVRDIDQA